MDKKEKMHYILFFVGVLIWIIVMVIVVVFFITKHPAPSMVFNIFIPVAFCIATVLFVFSSIRRVVDGYRSGQGFTNKR